MLISKGATTRLGRPLADGLSQAEYDTMMHTWSGRFPDGLSGFELEERFRAGGINAALHNTDKATSKLRGV